MKSFAFLLVALSAWTSAHSADIYRWTDESGRSHASDRPPAKGSARKVNSSEYELTDAQREDAALAKTRAEKARRERAAFGVALPEPSEASTPSSLSEVPPKESDCERMTRLYRESEACFGPYKLWNGATKAEAFERCKEVPEPSIKCGYVK